MDYEFSNKNFENFSNSAQSMMEKPREKNIELFNLLSSNRENRPLERGLSEAEDAFLAIIDSTTNNTCNVVNNTDPGNVNLMPQNQCSLDTSINEAEDAILSIIDQQSSRLLDENRSSGLVPFGEILRDIYETSNQTLNYAQNNSQITRPINTLTSVVAGTQQTIPNFPIPQYLNHQFFAPQASSVNYGNTNFPNYYDNQFSFNRINYQPNNTNIPLATSAAVTTAIVDQSSNRNYIDLDHIDKLIETVYEDDSTNTGSNSLNSADNISKGNNAGTITLPVDQELSQLIYNQAQATVPYMNTINNKKNWYTDQVANDVDNRNTNRNLYFQPNYMSTPTSKLQLLNNKPSILPPMPNAFNMYRGNGQWIDQQMIFRPIHKVVPKVKEFPEINPMNSCDPNFYYVNLQNDQSTLKKNVSLQSNQKFITPDMISCRPPIQTKRTISQCTYETPTAINQVRISENPDQLQTIEIISNNDYSDDCILYENRDDVSFIDFSALDTSDIIIQKVQKKSTEPLHKKRKQDLRVLDGAENFVFVYTDIQSNVNNKCNNYSSSTNVNCNENNGNSTICNVKSIEDSDNDNDIDKNNNFDNLSFKNISHKFVNEKTNDLPSANHKKYDTSKLLKASANITKYNNTKSNGSKLPEQLNRTNNDKSNNMKRENKLNKKKSNQQSIMKKQPKFGCFFESDNDITSDSDFEDLVVDDKSFKCKYCKKLLKSSKTLSSHMKRCKNLSENNKQKDLPKIVSTEIGHNHNIHIDENPNTYLIEYLDSETDLNDIKNSNISKSNDDLTMSDNMKLDDDDDEYTFRRTTRSQTKRKNENLFCGDEKIKRHK